MKHTVFENAIPLEVCNYIKEFFDKNENLQVHKPNNPNVVKINQPWKHFEDILKPIFSKYFDLKDGGFAGNLYKHSNLYTTHVDSSVKEYQIINVLLPIYLPDPTVDQRFVVFDQWIDNGIGQTWYGDRDVKYDFDYNKITQSIPYTDKRVYDKTDVDIDEDFYNKYLKFANHKHEYFKGLTGTAYSFKPGNLMLFNSNNLHSTGSLMGQWKMGLHMHFEGSLEELLL